jgi:hypothetical protein
MLIPGQIWPGVLRRRVLEAGARAGAGERGRARVMLLRHDETGRQRPATVRRAAGEVLGVR